MQSLWDSAHVLGGSRVQRSLLGDPAIGDRDLIFQETVGIQLSTWPSHTWTSLTSVLPQVRGARSVAAEATHVDEVALGVRRATCVGGPRDRTTGRAGAGWAGRGFVFGPRSAGGAGGRRTGPGDRGAVTPRHHAGRPPGVRCGAARALNRGRLECGVGSESPGRPCSPHGRPTLCPAVPLGQAGGPRAGRGFVLCGRAGSERGRGVLLAQGSPAWASSALLWPLRRFLSCRSK